jgi:hypothetical protein
MKRTEKIAIAILTGLCLGFIVGMLTSCVSKHPKCAAYDKVQTIEK